MGFAPAQFDALSLDRVRANRPEPEFVSGTHVEDAVLAFDDSTEEFADGRFSTPTDLRPTGTVTFRAHVRAKTGAASKNVAMSLYHVAVADGEAWDAAMTEEASGDQAIDASAANETVIEWTETVSNLGWQPNEIIAFKLSRQAASADNLSGDMYLRLFVIDLPIK